MHCKGISDAPMNPSCIHKIWACIEDMSMEVECPEQGGVQLHGACMPVMTYADSQSRREVSNSANRQTAELLQAGVQGN